MLTMILYMLYILSAQGLVGLIVSLAIALIVAAFVDSFEIVTAGVVVAGVAFVIVSRWMGIRTACRASEGFSDGTEHEITTLMDTLNKKKYGPDRVITPDPWSNAWGPTGVLSDSVEGFADAGTAGADNKPKDGEASSSTPAPVAASTNITATLNDQAKKVTDTLTNASANVTQAASEAAKKMTQTQPAPSAGAQSTSQRTTSGFTDGGSAGLFKLGELPSESKDGPHLDAGSTLMKAMSSLQPDQINAMTMDTQALLKTQQNLMGMLQSMQPILKDGRKLLDTFGGIFGGEGGTGMAKAFNLGA